MPFRYVDVEEVTLMMSDQISEKEVVHLSHTLLRRIVNPTTPKRLVRMIEVLANDIQKLEAEV